jgi:hypothetical protein
MAEERPASPDAGASFILPKDRPTDRQCAAIGRVAAAWSVIELLMERLLARLSMAPSLMGYVLTNRLAPDNRIGAIESLLTVHRQKYDDDFIGTNTRVAIKALLPKIKTLKDDRNFVVHSVWVSRGPDFLSRLDMGGAARSGIDISTGEPERLADIEQLSKTTQTVSDQLFALTNQLPRIDATSLDILQKREQQNRRAIPLRSARQYRRRSYTRL